MRRHLYFVYILASSSRRLYIGVTNDLLRRVWEHRHKRVPGFSARYNITSLVFFESTSDVRSAIRREKELKGWRREKKIALIEREKPWLARLGSRLARLIRPHTADRRVVI
jgi:putative endonuclease